MTRPYRDQAAWRKDQEELVLARIDRFARVDRAGRHLADLSGLTRRLADPSTFDSSLAALRSPEPPDPWLTEVSDLHKLVARRAAASPQSPLDALARRLGLAPHEVDVLRLLWVTQTSPLVHRLIRALWTDQDSGPLRLDVVTCLLADDDATRRALQLALSSGAALRRWRLVIAPDLSPGPWLPLEVPEAVLRVLEGDAPEQVLSAPVPPERLVTAAQWPSVAHLAAGPRPRILLVAPEGSAPRALVRGLAARTGQPLVVLDPALILRTVARGRWAIDELLRDALLADAWVLLELPYAWPDERDPAFDHLARDLAEVPVPLVATVERRNRVERRLTAGFTPVELAPLSTRELAELWIAASPAEPQPPSRADLEEVLADHRLSREATLGAAREAAARAAAQGHEEVEADDAVAACQGQIDAVFEGRATRIDAAFDWKDLVLPIETQTELFEVLAFATHKATVFERWGFGRKYPYGAGLSALFSGPSGTGKTMAACVLARSLDRPMYRVDLSQVFDRYVGETEKNLARIFDAAEAGRVVLLFDEADALFSQRSEVRSSNDRYANLEVNYLLQKMEEHTGIAILTTNLDASIDVAFRRRIRFTVHFPFPDEETRGRLWRSMIPPESDCDPDIAWARLARIFDLAGGAIKNAVLRAAFLAAGEGAPIAMRHLLRAGQVECAAMGKLVRVEE